MDRVDHLPVLGPDVRPPQVLGAATLTALKMNGASDGSLAELIERSNTCPMARLFDLSTLCQLTFDRPQAMALQEVAIEGAPCIRIARSDPGAPGLRMLALVSPGDLMANTPLDFITNHVDVALDLLFLVPGRSLPATVPDHDVMFFAASEPDAVTWQRMCRLHAVWPRPVLNDPSLLPLLARDRLPRLLSGRGGVFSPPSAAIGIERLRELARGSIAVGNVLPGAGYPILVRPKGSHAGIGLMKMDGPADVARYAAEHHGPDHFVTSFVDYRSADGLYRKSRVALIDGQPFLCHRAVSSSWMVHYLNAGMDASAGKRTEEALAMAQFDSTFAERHRAGLAELCRQLPFDYFSVDCGETADGRLVVFEADTAAIIHALEPADRYAYKHAQMGRVFDAFAAMLRRRCAASRAGALAAVG